MPRSMRRRKRSVDLNLLERLETRQLLTRRAVLDFDGEFLSAAQMAEGGWGGEGATTVTSFKNLITWDANGDAAVNVSDANWFIDRVVDQVRFDYMAYDLDIIVGDQDVWQPILTDGTVGDVMVIITGGGGSAITSAYGVAPWADIGNEHEEIVWAVGETLLDDFPDHDRFQNRLARTISHEMAHAFGLGHVISDPSGDIDPKTHHIMSSASPDTFHDFNFHDRDYDTDLYSYQTLNSVAHPEWNVNLQNAHELLSHPDVLGPSPDPWLAVLQPGKLTVVGDEQANTIVVAKGAGNDWVVTLDGEVFTFDSNAPGLFSINPFDAPMTDIFINAKGGNDEITVTTLLNADISVDGSTGDDDLNIDDEDNAAAATYALDAASLTRNGSVSITYSVEDLSVQAGSAADTFNIAGTAADDSVFLYGGKGNDTFNITPVGKNLDKIQGELSVFGQDHTDSVNVHDQLNPDGPTYTLGSGSLTRTGAAAITYSTDEKLTLNGGSAGSAYMVQGTDASTPVIINGGGANDTFSVGSAANSLDSIQGALTLAGKGGSDLLVLRDWGSGAGRVYTLTSTSVAPSGAALIKYATMESLHIHGTGFNDTLAVTSNSAATNTFFAGGGGSNTVVGKNANNKFNITGFNSGNLDSPALSFNFVQNLRGNVLNDSFRFSDGAQVTGGINGLGGMDTLDYSLYTTAVTVNLTAGTATGTGSVANIENVYGGSANDNLTGNAVANILWGNAGHDVLTGLAGDDVLSCGDGNDIATGGTGRDLIIGGRGNDNLSGSGGDDIMIGARTTYDANLAAQQAIMLEWSRLDANYATRVAHLKGLLPGTLSGATVLDITKIFDDAVADIVNGEGNVDWFFATGIDAIDKVAAETLN